MKRSAKILFAMCLAMIAAELEAAVTAAAESAVAVQDLVKVKTSDQVKAASWTRQPDSYTLQVVLDPSKYTGKRTTATATPEQKAAVPERKLPAQEQKPGADSPDGNNFFIGNTIANLRGLDPWFACGRTLTLIDGRRMVDGKLVAPPDPTLAYVNQPYPPKFKDRRVDAWLLKADGTQILPTIYSCVMKIPTREPVEISYRFSVADSEHAVAAAIRVDDDYFIEKLQPLEPKPVAQ